MTERSNFTVTGSIKEAKKAVKNGKIVGNNVSTFFINNDKAIKFKSFGGKDSAQILPENRKKPNINKEREPLFVPNK